MGCCLDPADRPEAPLFTAKLYRGPKSAKLQALARGSGCPEIVVTLNGAPATVTLDENCSFVVMDPAPTALLELRVELPELGLAGTIELVDVVDGELIEILVEVSDDSLSIQVVRRVAPGPSDMLPTEITDDDVSILLVAGDYDQVEGVQRDILPIVEGTTVNTKHGMVKTDHILFIAAGAFHVSKPSDLIPELQGRFPIRVELESLTRDDFVRILTEPRNALVKQ